MTNEFEETKSNLQKMITDITPNTTVLLIMADQIDSEQYTSSGYLNGSVELLTEALIEKAIEEPILAAIIMAAFGYFFMNNSINDNEILN